jgi:hypothetical protein
MPWAHHAAMAGEINNALLGVPVAPVGATDGTARQRFGSAPDGPHPRREILGNTAPIGLLPTRIELEPCPSEASSHCLVVRGKNRL